MLNSQPQRVIQNLCFSSRSNPEPSSLTPRSVIRRRVGIVVGAVFTAAILTAGISLFSANGDWGVVRQHLFGEVSLTNGSHSARTIGELNRLSWDNGLNILDTLDNMNAVMNQLAAPNLSADQEAVLEKKLTRYHNTLREQMNDRNTLEKTASLLHTRQLYSPEYSESMHDSLSRYMALKSRASSSGRLVEETQ